MAASIMREALQDATFYVYDHIDPRSGDIFYVGGGSYTPRRKSKYTRARERDARSKVHLDYQGNIREAGFSGFDHRIAIDGIVSAIDAALLERLRIAEGFASGMPLVNVHRGGEGIGYRYGYNPVSLGCSLSSFQKGGEPNKYGYRGVEKKGANYTGRLQKDGKQYGTRLYSTPYAAHVAYCVKTQELYGSDGLVMPRLPTLEEFLDLKYGSRGRPIYEATYPRLGHRRKRGPRPRLKKSEAEWSVWKKLGMHRCHYEANMVKHGCARPTAEAAALEAAITNMKSPRNKLGVVGLSFKNNRYSVRLAKAGEVFARTFADIHAAVEAINAKLVGWYGDKAVLQVAPSDAPVCVVKHSWGVQKPRYMPVPKEQDRRGRHRVGTKHTTEAKAKMRATKARHKEERLVAQIHGDFARE